MENKILDEIEKKYKDSLSSEKTKISELVEGIELEEGMDNKIVEALIGASLLSLQNGYELYKRRVKDGLIAEPNDYLEVLSYKSVDELKDDIEKFINEKNIRKEVIETLERNLEKLNRIVLPLSLSQKYGEQWKKLLKSWSEWFNNKLQAQQAQEPKEFSEEKKIYLEDFLNFITNFYSNLDTPIEDPDVLAMLIGVFNVFMEADFILLICYFFVREENEERKRRILNMVLALKGKNDDVVEGVGKILYTLLSDSKKATEEVKKLINATEEVKNLINACRLPLKIIPPDNSNDSIEAILEKARENAGLPEGTNFQKILAEFIVKEMISADPEHLYYRGVNAKLQRSYATVSFEIKPSKDDKGDFPTRFMKIGKKEKIEGEKAGTTLFFEEIPQDERRRFISRIDTKYKIYNSEGIGVIGYIGESGETFSSKFDELEPDIIRDCLEKLFKYHKLQGIQNDEPLSTYYKFGEWLKDEKIKAALNKGRTFPLALTHGDLTGDNFIIKKEKEGNIIYLIDFGNVEKKGHYLKDFVSFEAYIRVYLFERNIHSEEELGSLINDWLKLEEFIESGTEVKEIEKIGNANHRNVVYAIREIRKIVYKFYQDWLREDIKDKFEEEYTLCLLFYLSKISNKYLGTNLKDEERGATRAYLERLIENYKGKIRI